MQFYTLDVTFNLNNIALNLPHIECVTNHLNFILNIANHNLDKDIGNIIIIFVCCHVYPKICFCSINYHDFNEIRKYEENAIENITNSNNLCPLDCLF